MPAITGTLLAAASFAASAVGTVAQSRAQKKQAKSAKKANRRAEDRATVEAKRVQATDNLTDADVELESDVLATDRKSQTGSRLRVGKSRKSGIKL